MSNGSPDDIRLKYLLEKYLANSCSKEELDMLLASVSENAGSDVLRLTLEACWEQASGEKPAPELDAAALYQAILQREWEFGSKRRLRRRRLARYRTVTLASVLAIVLAWGIVLMWRPRPSAVVKQVVAAHSRFKNDVQPGGNKAVLVLANGQSIVLDSASNGMLAMQGGMKVVKLSNGQLVYRAGQDNGQDNIPVYNTISTPRGGQYQLVLQDGTRIWLNAESSIRFPTVFKGRDRMVELSGEAYFEVAPRAANPFKIYMLNQPSGAEKNRKEIDVLGTKFNVMAYEEEKVIRTTLLEGAIQVGDESQKNLMKPGQQAEWQPAVSGVRITDDADIDAAVAWKNGFFNFDRCDIQTIMRQLSRWYDLKVTYKDGGTDKTFWGGIEKDLPLSDVLRILEKSGVEFSIDGKNVIVNM